MWNWSCWIRKVWSVLALNIIICVVLAYLTHWWYTGTWKDTVEQEVHCGTLKGIKKSKVRGSILPVNNPFKKFIPIIRLHIANEAKPSWLATRV